MAVITEARAARDTQLFVPGRDLVAGLKAVIPHAGQDDTLPQLTCVQLEVAESALTLTATDQYTAGRYTIPLDEPRQGSELRFLLFADDAKAWAKHAKSSEKVLLEINNAEAILHAGGERLASERMEILTPNFPNVLWLIERAIDDIGGSGTLEYRALRLNTNLLPRFNTSAKAIHGRGLPAMELHMGSKPHSMTIVKIGEQFIGLIQPMRHNPKS